MPSRGMLTRFTVPSMNCSLWCKLCIQPENGWFPLNSHATTSPISTSCQTEQCYSLQCVQLCKTIDDFFPPNSHYECKPAVSKLPAPFHLDSPMYHNQTMWCLHQQPEWPEISEDIHLITYVFWKQFFGRKLQTD